MSGDTLKESSFASLVGLQPFDKQVVLASSSLPSSSSAHVDTNPITWEVPFIRKQPQIYFSISYLMTSHLHSINVSTISEFSISQI